MYTTRVRSLALPLACLAAASGCDSPSGPSDSVAPTVEVSAPVFHTNQASYSLSGVAMDDQGVVRVGYVVDGGAEQSVSLDGGTRAEFALPLTLSPGAHTVEIRAYDRAGNRGTAGTSVVLDVTAPVVSIATPTTNSQFRSFLLLDGSSTDEYPYSVTYSANGGAPVAIGVNRFNTQIYGLPLGENNIVVRARDWAGNESAEYRLRVYRAE